MPSIVRRVNALGDEQTGLVILKRALEARTRGRLQKTRISMAAGALLFRFGSFYVRRSVNSSTPATAFSSAVRTTRCRWGSDILLLANMFSHSR